MKSDKIILYKTDAEGYDLEVELPTCFGVCPRCKGEGKHVNPNIDGNGITSSEMEELGQDFIEDYLGGVYDVTCQECGGLRVVPVLDESRVSEADLKAYQDQEENAARDRAADAYTRRMESGGYDY